MLASVMDDDCVIYVTQTECRVKSKGTETGVVLAGQRGFPGVANADALAHIEDTDNPHKDSATGLVPPGGNNGKWFKLSADGLVITDETPIYLKDVPAPTSEDGYIKTDAGGTALTLASVCAFPMTVEEHELHFKGDAKVAKRCYYGTDAVGNLGFYRKKAVS